jgi:hypothetical protein
MVEAVDDDAGGVGCSVGPPALGDRTDDQF